METEKIMKLLGDYKIFYSRAKNCECVLDLWNHYPDVDADKKYCQKEFDFFY